MLWLFNTLGWIFGPLMMLAGVVAVVLCVRASLRTSTPRTRRAAVAGSLAPFVVGLAAALFGLVFWLVQAQAVAPQDALQALGKAVLAGLIVTAVPLAWALSVVRTRRQAA